MTDQRDDQAFPGCGSSAPWRVDFGHAVQANPLRTKADVQRAFLQLTEPLARFYSPGGARLMLDNTGAHYWPVGAWMEGFSRILWGAAPLLGGGGETPFLDLYRRGLVNGTDPDHPEYWGGDVGFADQRMVEMAAIGLCLMIAREGLWDPMTVEQQDNLVAFLQQINEHDPAPNNWLFFRVMVCMGLRSVGRSVDEEQLARTLDQLETFYLADGWYGDGKGGKCDYYNPWAMHFYGLLYAAHMGDVDPERAARFRERAEAFARDFIHWFDEEGRAIPYGRSLTYRFAQSGFWAAYAYAGCEGIAPGVVKGLLLRNLRWWFAQDMLSRDGVLTIGYGYPNLIMGEDYNAPGSPYWAFKTFLALALPEDGPFWSAEELPLPPAPRVAVQRHAGFLVQDLGGHRVALSSGQQMGPAMANIEAKYCKFAYSTMAAFSVSKGHHTPTQGAFDSMLAVTEKGEHAYRIRGVHELVAMRAEYLHSRWSPMRGVRIDTWLIPANPWHVRVHIVHTERDLSAIEGGFAIARETRPDERDVVEADDRASARYPWGTSTIVNVYGKRTPVIVKAEANTNLQFNRTNIPSLEGDLAPGVHRLACAVYLGTESDPVAPVVKVEEDLVRIDGNAIPLR